MPRPATDRQLAYLRRLIRQHPEAGCDEEDIDDLSVAEASSLIDNLINGTFERPDYPTSQPEAQVAPDAASSNTILVVPGLAEIPPEKPFAPSSLQAAIFGAIATTEDNLFIEAVAGSGKTTTIVRALELLEGKRVLFCAFNKSIADELRERVPGFVDVKTLHSLGFQALRSAESGIKLDDDVVRTVVEDLLPRRVEGPERTQAVNLAEKMISLLKNCLVAPDDREGIVGILDHFGVDDNGVGQTVIPLLPMIFSRLEGPWRKLITFDDMIYRPIKDNVTMPHYDVVLVDEAQDLNPAQIQMIRRMEARTIAVGDPSQSIYGFRGADIDAIPNLVTALSMRRLPLSITYRCPASHVRLAQGIVPHIQARDGAPEGAIDYMRGDQLFGNGVLTPGSLVLCRCNAPLVSAAFALIRSGVPATVRGRDIGQGLISLVKKLARPGDDVNRLIERAREHHQNERSKLVRRNAAESRLQSLDDRIDTLYALTEGLNEIAEVVRRAETLFSDADGRGTVVFSSVHRAKGLEAETVAIAQPWLMPLKHAKQDWEVQQEHNLMYVAFTRSKNRLIFEAK